METVAQNMADPQWDKLKGIFHIAVSMPPKDRPAYLDGACGGDALLRQSVEALLRSHEESGFVDEPAYAAVANLLAYDEQVEQRPGAAGFRAGQNIGRYRINSLLGEGGMGRVYLAEDTKLHRKVSLKFLSKAVTRDHEKLLRFEQEARAASALSHPNIVTIHEFGEEDGQQFIATEYVEGQTLRQRLQRPIELNDALEIAIQIASALVAAHRVSIVHRDIKPDNIIIRKDDGLVKVLDFGLAKVLSSRELSTKEIDGEASTRFKTGPGVVMGTVAYMSPEQARGDMVDERTDIWSLGVVLYEMIAGSTPFVADTSNEIISGILSKQPAPPLARFSHDLPHRLQEIVDKSLAKDRDERYQTSKDLLIDVKRLKQSLELKAGFERSLSTGEFVERRELKAESTTSGAVLKTHPVSSAEYLVNQITNHKRTVAVIATLFIVTAGVLIAGVTKYKFGQKPLAAIGPPTINSIAVLPLVYDNADADAEFLSEGITDNLIERLSQIPGLRVMSHTAVFHYKGRETDPRTIASELGVEAVLAGRLIKRNDVLNLSLELVNSKDNTHLWGEQYDRKVSDLLTLQREIPLDVSDKLRLRLSGEARERLTRAPTENTEAYQLYLKGRHAWEKWTVDGAKQAVNFFEEAIKRDPKYALAYSGLADAYLFGTGVGPDVPPKEAHRRAREAATKAMSLDPQLGEAHAALAEVLLYDNWDFAGAERELKRALELNPNYAEGHHQYSHLLLLLGRNPESLIESQKFLELDPVSEPPIGHLAYHYLYSRQYDEAIKQFQKDIQLYPDTPQYVKYANAFFEKGMYKDAVEQFLKAFEKEGLGPKEINRLKQAFANSGSEGFLRELLKILKGYPESYDLSVNIAEVHARLHEKDEAFRWLEKAYAQHSDPILRLKEEIGFDNLRSDPRYGDLLRRIGFPP